MRKCQFDIGLFCIVWTLFNGFKRQLIEFLTDPLLLAIYSQNIYELYYIIIHVYTLSIFADLGYIKCTFLMVLFVARTHYNERWF